MEEDEPKRSTFAGLPRPLAGMSVGELEDYRVQLEAEIRRVDAELARSRDVRGAAEALFKRPG